MAIVPCTLKLPVTWKDVPTANAKLEREALLEPFPIINADWTVDVELYCPTVDWKDALVLVHKPCA